MGKIKKRSGPPLVWMALTAIVLTGCYGIPVVVDDCSWVDPIYLSDPEINSTPATVKRRIARHNAKFEAVCSS